LANTLPPSSIRKTIFIDPLDTHVVGFNPIENISEEQRTLVTSNIVAAIKHVYGDSWGPRMEDILYFGFRLLLDTPGTTLVHYSRLIHNRDYREKLLHRCSDPATKEFWRERFGGWPVRDQQQSVEAALNKVSKYRANPYIRDILGSKSTFTMDEVARGEKNLIISIPKTMGENEAKILGALFVSSVWQAVQRNGTADVSLIADEFQNYAAASFAAILSEARKYRLSLTIANQYLGQLPLGLADAVVGNVGTFVAFRVGASDAATVAAVLGIPNPEAVQDTENYRAQVRFLRGQTRAWGMKTRPPVPPTGSLKSVLRQTRAGYARPRSHASEQARRAFET
jgi:hypothetical protein